MTTASRVLFDTNVILDVLLARAPFVDAASLLWALAESRAIQGLVSAHAVTTVHFLAGRQRDRTFARDVTQGVLSVFDVAPVTGDVLRAAVARAGPDFEDDTCLEAGINAGCDLLITRDESGFPDSPLPVLEPWEALSVLWPST